MLRFLTIALIVLTTSFAQAAFQEVVARCVVPGKNIENSRVYSLHINDSKTKGILIAIDTDKLTEAEYGDVKVSKNGRISMPSADATFTPAHRDAGGDARIKGLLYNCDFAQ